MDSGLKGRAFYTVKDKEMASNADYGFVLWDGKSPGSLNNVFELAKRRKPTLVYFSKTKTFHEVSSREDVESLLNKCDSVDYHVLSQKVSINKRLKELTGASQSAWNF